MVLFSDSWPVARALGVLHAQESVLARYGPLALSLDVEGELMCAGLNEDVGVRCLLSAGGQADVGHVLVVVAAAAGGEGHYCDGQGHQASECSFHCCLVLIVKH